MRENLNWAVLGTGVIANEMAQALQKMGKSLYAVGNRTHQKTIDFAEKYGVGKVYDQIEDMFEDENVDIIYITSMGKLETVQDAMLKSIGASPAWQSLAAVRSGHVYFLPQELFLLSPGIKYPQAAEYMAKLAYPEKFE